MSFTIPIKLSDRGMRLDRFILNKFPKLSHSLLCKLLRKNDFKLINNNSAQVKNIEINTRIENGQELICPSMLKDNFSHDEVNKNAMKRMKDANITTDDYNRCRNWILYADSHFIAINKPHGLPVQGGKGITRALDSFLPIFRDVKPTTIEQHKPYFEISAVTGNVETFEDPEMTRDQEFLSKLSIEERLMIEDEQKQDDLEIPRLVHRLDAETSGVMLLARTRVAAHRLTSLFRSHSYEKMYWSIVFGRPSKTEGTIDLPLVPIADLNGDKPTERAVSAKTAYRVLADRSDGLATWLMMQPKTGRKHQLRRHAEESLGTPILGDPKYGLDIVTDSQNKKNQLYGMLDVVNPGLHLHARKLRFVHPFFPKKMVTITAPPPAHMVRSMKKLKFIADDEKL